MSLFRFHKEAQALHPESFAAEFCYHPQVQKALECLQGTVKLLPFDPNRDFKNIQLLYPAWTARELAMQGNVKSNLSKLNIIVTNAPNYFTCLINAQIAFILGFVPVLGRNVLEVSMLSGKALKRKWSHKIADIFNIWLSYLIKTYPNYFLIASCDDEVEVYKAFTKSFNFYFWENYEYNERKYSLYIFKTILED